MGALLPGDKSVLSQARDFNQNRLMNRQQYGIDSEEIQTTGEQYDDGRKESSRDYRQTLIQRREDIDTKIAKVEAEIKKLKGEK